jgi:DNA gyrase inhibitor GyrI
MAGVAAGAALLGGAAFYYLRERSTEEPDYRALESEGDYQIRDYPALSVAEAVAHGPRGDALKQAYRTLSEYLELAGLTFAVPVIQDGGDPMASDPPLFDDELEGAWRTRFVLPAGQELPELPEGIELVELPARKVAVVAFAGRATDELLEQQEDRLRGWLAKRGEKADGEGEYAFYNSPMIPGPLRRNEVWLALS